MSEGFDGMVTSFDVTDDDRKRYARRRLNENAPATTFNPFGSGVPHYMANPYFESPSEATITRRDIAALGIKKELVSKGLSGIDIDSMTDDQDVIAEGIFNHVVSSQDYLGWGNIATDGRDVFGNKGGTMNGRQRLKALKEWADGKGDLMSEEQKKFLAMTPEEQEKYGRRLLSDFELSFEYLEELGKAYSEGHNGESEPRKSVSGKNYTKAEIEKNPYLSLVGTEESPTISSIYADADPYTAIKKASRNYIISHAKSKLASDNIIQTLEANSDNLSPQSRAFIARASSGEFDRDAFKALPDIEKSVVLNCVKIRRGKQNEVMWGILPNMRDKNGEMRDTLRTIYGVGYSITDLPFDLGRTIKDWSKIGWNKAVYAFDYYAEGIEQANANYREAMDDLDLDHKIHTTMTQDRPDPDSPIARVFSGFGDNFGFLLVSEVGAFGRIAAARGVRISGKAEQIAKAEEALKAAKLTKNAAAIAKAEEALNVAREGFRVPFLMRPFEKAGAELGRAEAKVGELSGKLGQQAKEVQAATEALIERRKLAAALPDARKAYNAAVAELEDIRAGVKAGNVEAALGKVRETGAALGRSTRAARGAGTEIGESLASSQFYQDMTKAVADIEKYNARLSAMGRSVETFGKISENALWFLPFYTRRLDRAAANGEPFEQAVNSAFVTMLWSGITEKAAFTAASKLGISDVRMTRESYQTISSLVKNAFARKMAGQSGAGTLVKEAGKIFLERQTTNLAHGLDSAFNVTAQSIADEWGVMLSEIWNENKAKFDKGEITRDEFMEAFAPSERWISTCMDVIRSSGYSALGFALLSGPNARFGHWRQNKSHQRHLRNMMGDDAYSGYQLRNGGLTQAHDDIMKAGQAAFMYHLGEVAGAAGDADMLASLPDSTTAEKADAEKSRANVDADSMSKLRETLGKVSAMAARGNGIATTDAIMRETGVDHATAELLHSMARDYEDLAVRDDFRQMYDQMMERFNVSNAEFALREFARFAPNARNVQDDGRGNLSVEIKVGEEWRNVGMSSSAEVTREMMERAVMDESDVGRHYEERGLGVWKNLDEDSRRQYAANVIEGNNRRGGNFYMVGKDGKRIEIPVADLITLTGNTNQRAVRHEVSHSIYRAAEEMGIINLDQKAAIADLVGIDRTSESANAMHDKTHRNWEVEVDEYIALGYAEYTQGKSAPALPQLRTAFDSINKVGNALIDTFFGGADAITKTTDLDKFYEAMLRGDVDEMANVLPAMQGEAPATVAQSVADRQQERRVSAAQAEVDRLANVVRGMEAEVKAGKLSKHSPFLMQAREKLARAERALADVKGERHAISSQDTRYSLEKDIHDAINTDRTKGDVVKGAKRIVFGKTSNVLKAVGLPEADVYTKAFIVRKIVSEHDVTENQIIRFNEYMSSPCIVFDDYGKGYIIVTDDMAPDEDGVMAPLSIVIRPDAEGNYIASAYSRKEAAEAKYVGLFKDGKVLYFDKNKAANLSLRGEAQSSLNTFNVGGSVITPEEVTADSLPQSSSGGNGSDINSLGTPEQSKAYEEAILDGDDERAVEILRDVAAKAMPDTKVVDADGKPKIVYHHTEADTETGKAFTQFDLGKARKSMDIQGFFFFDNPTAGDEYGSLNYACFLNITNPYVIDSQEKMDALKWDGSKDNEGVRVREELMAQGYDGVVRKAEFMGDSADEWIAFNPEQIKLADTTYADEYGESPIALEDRFDFDNGDIRFSLVTDKDTLDKLNNAEYITVYRAAIRDGNSVLSPKATRINGVLNRQEIGKWYKSDENLDLIKKGKFKLDGAGLGSDIMAAYAPYWHTRVVMANSQFSAAWKRPDITVFECRIPKFEFEGKPYQAEGSDKDVGLWDWSKSQHADENTPNAAKVYLSQYVQVVREVPVEEIADNIVSEVGNAEIPWNTVSAPLRQALRERGANVTDRIKGLSGSALAQAKAAQEAERNEDRYSLKSLGVPYQGSKGQFAEDLVNILPSGTRFVDIFSGGGAMTHAAMRSGKFGAYRMNDLDGRGQDLFLGAMDGDYNDYATERTAADWDAIRGTPEGILRSRMGNGRQFNADKDTTDRNIRRVQRIGDELGGRRGEVEDSKVDYREVKLKEGDVVYADIPYAGTDTTAYNGAGKFDHKAFNEWAQYQDVPVYVSSYAMPEGWTQVYEKQTKGIRGNKTERLFVQDKFAYKMSEVKQVGNDAMQDFKAADVEMSDNGDVLVERDGNGRERYSLRTWEEGGRGILADFVAKAIKNGDLSEKDGKAMLSEMDAMYKAMKEMEKTSAQFGMWSRAIVGKREDGNPVMCVIKTNGDYAMNLDFSTLCKKRRAFDRVLREIIKRGDIDKLRLDEADFVNINKMIREAGFEVACELCFVDSKRYRGASIAQRNASLYNRLVNTLLPAGSSVPVEKFNLGENPNYTPQEGALHTLSDDVVSPQFAALDAEVEKMKREMIDAKWEAARKKAEGNSRSKKSYEQNLAKVPLDKRYDIKFAKKALSDSKYQEFYGGLSKLDVVAMNLKNDPTSRRHLVREDILDSRGFFNAYKGAQAVVDLYNNMGTAKPKETLPDVAFGGGEIVGDKKWRGVIEGNGRWTPEAAYAVGGVRVQSFSDFVPHMVFDYMQMFAELAAKKLPAHAYTKELLFARIFGMTGLKVNMSLVPAVDKALGKEYAGLTRVADGKLTYLWNEGGVNADGVLERTRSFPFEEAIKIQSDKRYSKNVGTIAVGVSDAQILMMLDDPNIRMVIPYHKSSISPIVASLYNIDMYNDYTDIQTTKGAKAKQAPSFNDLVRQHKSAKKAADAYLKWCADNGCTPKFEKFSKHENYYKLLEDFTVEVDGKYAAQEAVQMSNKHFPAEVMDLIQQGLREDDADAANLEAALQGNENDLANKIVEELGIGKDEGRNSLAIPPEMSNAFTPEDLLTMAAAGRLAKNAAGEDSVRRDLITRMRQINPKVTNDDIDRVMNRAKQDAANVTKGFEFNSDKDIAQRLTKAQAERYYASLRRAGRGGIAEGVKSERALRKFDEKAAQKIADSIAAQTGIAVNELEASLGVDISDMMLRLNEVFDEADKSRGADAAAELESKIDAETDGLVDDDATAMDPKEQAKLDLEVRKLCDEIANKAWEKTEEWRKRKAERDAKRKEQERRAADTDESDTDAAEEIPDVTTPEDIARFIATKHRVDLRNPAHFAQFISVMCERKWIEDHGLSKDAYVWNDPVALQHLRMTALGVYDNLARKLMYGQKREQVFRTMRKLENAGSYGAVMSEMEFCGKLVAQGMITEKAVDLVRDIEKMLEQGFGAKGRFSQNKEQIDRKVAGLTELWARDVRKVIWWGERKCASEMEKLMNRMAGTQAAFDLAGRDVDSSKQFNKDVRLMSAIRQYGDLRHKSLGEIADAKTEILKRLMDDTTAKDAQAREERTLAMADILGKAFDTGRTEQYDDPKDSALTKVRKGLSRYFQMHLDFKNLLLDLTRYCKDADARNAAEDFINNLQHDIQRRWDTAQTEMRMEREWFHGMIEGIYGKGSFAKTMKELFRHDARFDKFGQGEVNEKTGGVTMVKMSKAQALNLYVAMQQKGYVDNVTKNHRESQSSELRKLFTREDLMLIKAMGEWYDRGRESLSRVSERIFGLPVLAEESNYFPVTPLRPTQGLEKGGTSGWSPFPPALTARIRHGYDFDVRADLFTVWMDHMNQQAQWKAMADLGIELRGIFGRQSVQSVIRRCHGQAALQNMQSFITDILNGQFQSFEPKWITESVNWMRGWSALAALGGNLGVMIKQITSIPAVAFEVGFVDMGKHLATAFTPDGIEAMKEIWNSDQRINRWDVGNSEEVTNAFGSYASNPSLLKRAMQKSMIFNKVGDSVPALIMGQGIYRSFLRKGLDKAEAMNRTWEIINRTQQTSQMDNLSVFQRRSALGRAITQFQSTVRQYTSYEIAALRQLLARPNDEKAWKDAGRATILNMMLAGLYALGGSVWGWILGKDPDDDDIKNWIESVLTSCWGSLFAIGSFAQTAASILVEGKGQVGKMQIPALNLADNLLTEATKMGVTAVKLFGDAIGWGEESDLTLDDLLKSADRFGKRFSSPYRDVRKVWKYRVAEEEE